MSALLTSTYNTGWMNGNIKGAFLSDTDDTDLVGATYDESFDDNSNGWTGLSGDNNLEITGGQLVSLAPRDGQVYAAKRIYTGILAGDLVEISFTVSSVDVGLGPRLVSDLGNLQYYNAGSHIIYMVAPIDNPTLGIQVRQNNEWKVDNISVKLADADRSVNNNGLTVNGTVTRTPVATGADLVGYGGFDYAATKYLSQPYNPALAFGTGDFCLMWWNMAVTTTSQFRWLLGLYDPVGGERRLAAYMTSPGGLRLRINNLEYAVVNNTAIPAANAWNLFAFVRKDGVVSLYRDGVLLVSQSAPVAINSAATDEFRIGGLGSLGPDLSRFALLRISATAPTAEQIAKIYEDEKVLFQENAQATLYGSSDAVTALAHDDATNLLHVGTSGGRSVFQGLRRVSNTTTAVGTAISASNGLVVEE